MRRAYQGDWMDAIPSRFINELPDENIEKNEVFKDDNKMNLNLTKINLLI